MQSAVSAAVFVAKKEKNTGDEIGDARKNISIVRTVFCGAKHRCANEGETEPAEKILFHLLMSRAVLAV